MAQPALTNSSSLAPGRGGCSLTCARLTQIVINGILKNSDETAFKWMAASLDRVNSALVHVNVGLVLLTNEPLPQWPLLLRKLTHDQLNAHWFQWAFSWAWVNFLSKRGHWKQCWLCSMTPYGSAGSMDLACQVEPWHCETKPMGTDLWQAMGSSAKWQASLRRGFISSITPHLPVSSRILGCEENLYFERWNSRTHPPI